MELSHWFEYQLQSTLEGLIWAVRQVPKERSHLLPPTSLGEWSASQHISHILAYERNLALPSMYQWLGTPPPARKERNENQNPATLGEMLNEFEQVRHAEIALLVKFDEDTWNSIKNTTFWGEVSLFWLVSKTYQHTLEHTHDILRLALFWDRVLKRMTQEQE